MDEATSGRWPGTRRNEWGPLSAQPRPPTCSQQAAFGSVRRVTKPCCDVSADSGANGRMARLSQLGQPSGFRSPDPKPLCASGKEVPRDHVKTSLGTVSATALPPNSHHAGAWDTCQRFSRACQSSLPSFWRWATRKLSVVREGHLVLAGPWTGVVLTCGQMVLAR